jgi:hypothetical protein
MVRPRVFDPDDVAVKLEEYVDRVDMPTTEGFCTEYGMSKDTFYRLCGDEVSNPALSDCKKRADAKAEHYIVTNALAGKGHPIFAMFLLKQARFGYKDKIEQEIKQDITVDIALPPDYKRIAE